MSGSIHPKWRSYKGHRYLTHFVKFKQKHYYRHYLTGQFMTLEMANILLAEMQSDWNRGVFSEDKFKKARSTVLTLIDNYLEAKQRDLTPGVYRNYLNYINKHHRPFFTENPIMLHEVRKATVVQFFHYVPLEGVGKFNVVDILKFMLNWAYENELIDKVPPFPPRKAYKIQTKKPIWLPSDRQGRLIHAIPEENRPIFQFWSMHPVRGAECRQLLKEDYDPIKDVFRIHRSESLRRGYEGTKTGREYLVPCAENFKPIMAKMPKTFSPYLFSSHRCRTVGNHYTYTIMRKIFRAACEIIGEDIRMNQAFRSSLASQLINEDGVPVESVRDLFGHTNIKTTQRYGEAEIPQKRKILNRKIVRLTKKVI